MTVFGMDSRGKFRSVGLDTKDGKGIRLSIAGSNPVGASSLVTSFSLEQSESFAISQCLNGGVYLYSFGHSPQQSNFSVGVTSFLMSCDGSVGGDINTLLSSYRDGRVSQSKKTAMLSVGTGSLEGYLIRQNMAVSDNNLSMITTTYQFIALSPQGK